MEAFFVFWEKDKQKYVYSIYVNKEGGGGATTNEIKDTKFKTNNKN